jgi:predicted  nucleic acid-binding Zn-ribbon protein
MEELKKDETPDMEHAEQEEPESRIIEFFEYREGTIKPELTKKLLSLYELTKIDKELADIDEEKGDLPGKIAGLKETIAATDKKIKENKNILKNLEKEEKKLQKENKEIDEKVNKYDDLKYSVKNNKEYDEIMKTIDSNLELEVNNEKRLKEIHITRVDTEKETEELEKSKTEFKTNLTANEKLLEELTQQYKDEESELYKNRKSLLSKLDEDLRNLYERINGSLKGEATAIVRRGNCSGCYNSVPPQREIEIKIAEEIYTCQSCGRILIDESLVSNK